MTETIWIRWHFLNYTLDLTFKWMERLLWSSQITAKNNNDSFWIVFLICTCVCFSNYEDQPKLLWSIKNQNPDSMPASTLTSLKQCGIILIIFLWTSFQKPGTIPENYSKTSCLESLDYVKEQMVVIPNLDFQTDLNCIHLIDIFTILIPKYKEVKRSSIVPHSTVQSCWHYILVWPLKLMLGRVLSLRYLLS